MKQKNNSPFTIEDTVFVDCPASDEGKVVVPSGITDIGDKALMFCNKVNEIELPDSLEGIGLCAFEGCINLRHIKMSVDTVFNTHTFDGCPETITIERYI